MRFQVGLMMIWFRHTCAGIATTKWTVSPMSSGCTMRARSSAGIGTGRLSMMSVETSPGQMAQARMPLTHSSMLRFSVSAFTACLAAV